MPKCTSFFIICDSVLAAYDSIFGLVYVEERSCSQSLFTLFEKYKESSYRLRVYYSQSRFIDPTNENFGCLYFQTCNKSCHLFVFYCCFYCFFINFKVLEKM